MSVNDSNHIRYTCIGHCCHDKLKDGFSMGGTASFSAIVASNLGAKSKIITAYGPDFLYEETLREHDIEIVNLGSTDTTVFENIYGKGARQQYLHSRADTIDPSKAFPYIHQVDILHLCPIADEVDYEIIRQYNAGIIGATVQGSLRCWGKDKKVFPCEMEWEKLKGIDVVIISDEDIIGLDHALEHISRIVPLVVVTMGRKGAKIIEFQVSKFLPSYPIIEKRETGAGDTFATAFFLHYHKSSDPISACIYAHAVTSLVLERSEEDPFPVEIEIDDRIEEYQNF